MRRVEIRVTGHLDADWSAWLEGFTIAHTQPNETVLSGKVEDQSSLYGRIAKLRDLGAELTAFHSVLDMSLREKVYMRDAAASGSTASPGSTSRD
jgi:hypothetical protein